MVASRKKLKQAEAEAEATNGDAAVEALKLERKSKVKKRKELKHQVAKRTRTAKEDGEAETKQAEEVSASPEQQQSKEKRKKQKQKKKQNLDRADAEVNAAGVDIPEVEMVLNVSNAGDEAAGNKRKAVDKEKPKNKRNKKKRLDKWGAPVADAPPEDLQEYVEQREGNGDHQQEQYNPRKIYVGGLPFSTSEDEIHSYFAECGAIEELDCSMFADTGRFRGIAFITFKTEAAAAKALELDGADMGGRYLRIQKCIAKQVEPKEQTHREPPPKTQGCLSVYIGNMSWEVTEDDVRRFFKGCNVKSVRFASDKATGDFKGYGHVDFYDDESVDAAVKLDQQLMLGRPTKVSYAVPFKQSNAKRASKQCHVCREEGHVSFQCPKNVRA